MARLRRAILVGGGTGGLAAVLTALALWFHVDRVPLLPTLQVPGWVAYASLAGLAVWVLGAAGVLLPRRWMRRLGAVATGGMAGLLTLVAVYPPSFRWLLEIGITRPIVEAVSGWNYFSSSNLSTLRYRGEAIAASIDGMQWTWNPRTGDPLSRVPEPVAPLRTPSLTIRELPIEAIRADPPMVAPRPPDPITVTRTQLPPRLAQGGMYRGNFYPKEYQAVLSKTSTKEALFTILSEDRWELSPDRKRLLVARHFQPHGALWRTCLLGSTLILFDLEEERIVWTRSVPCGTSRFSPSGSYIFAGGHLLEASTAKTLASAGGHPIRWLESDRMVCLMDGSCATVRTLPDLEVLGSAGGLPTGNWVFRGDLGQIAIVDGVRIRLFTFPALKPVRELRAISVRQVIDVSCALGCVIAFLTAFVSLSVPARSTTGPREQPPGSRFGRTVVLAYLAVLPVAALFSERLPVRLPDGPAALSVVAAVALLVVATWLSFRRLPARIAAVALVLAATPAVLIAVQKRAREELAISPISKVATVDERSVVDREKGHLVELGSGRTLATLGPASRRVSLYRREGDKLVGLWGAVHFQWDLPTSTLERGFMASESYSDWAGFTFCGGGKRRGDRVVPLLLIHELGKAKDLASPFWQPDETLIYTEEKEGRTRIMKTRVGRLKILELPLYTLAVAALLGIAFHAPAAWGARRMG
jgi:hypothetical protein